jgi:hypothetical protein
MSNVGRCPACGSHLTPEDFQQPACRYCGAAFVHHAEAAAKVAQLQAVMGMMRPPVIGGPTAPVNPSHVVVTPGLAPVQHASAQYVGPAPGVAASPPAFGGPIGSPAAPAAGGGGRIVMVVIALIVVGAVAVVVVAGAVLFFGMR